MINRWDGGKRVVTYDCDCFLLGYEWLFDRLRLIGFDVSFYEHKENVISLRGSYRKENTSMLKKFFYDNYPAIDTITPTRHGMRIYFKMKARIIHQLPTI